jgi:TolB protein
MHPDWSPDGHKMVYLSNRLGDYQLFVTSISDSLTGDSAATRVTTAADSIGADCYPSFSPDGLRIVYTASKTGREEIFTMNPDGSNKIQVTNFDGTKRRPRFSPSGDKIAFASNMWTDGSDSLQIYTIHWNGGGLDTVTIGGNNYDPAWSPDGQSIIYAKRISRTKSYLYICNTNGSNEIQLVDESKSYYPIWRNK